MNPGIYHDLPFEEYAALPFLNQSVLKRVAVENGGSPKHAKAAFDGDLERDDSRALQMGRAEHCLICEGEEEFKARFVVATPCEAILKSGDRKNQECGCSPVARSQEGNWYCGKHAESYAALPVPDAISRDQVQRIHQMAAAVQGHKINGHLRRSGWSECTIVYDVPVKRATLDKSDPDNLKTIHIDTALRHKVRIDRLAQPTATRPHLIVDLKRMQVGEGSMAARARAIERYGWDVQAAMYTEAVRQHFGVSECEWIWVFVEEGPPFDIRVIPADEDTLTIGADKLLRYRATWAECEARNEWPGQCADGPTYGGLSEFAVKDYRRTFGIDGKLQVEA